MEPEEERLRRQIRLLQGLINDHKNVHGNAPVPPTPASLSRWRNPNQAAFNARYDQQPSRDFQPGQASTATWRKKYSLVNAPPRPALSSAPSVSPSTSWATQSRAGREALEPQLMLLEAKAISGAKADIGLQTGSLAGDAAGSGFEQGFSGSRKGPSASRGSLPTAARPFSADSRPNKETCAPTSSHGARCKTLAMGGSRQLVAGQKKPVGKAELSPSLGRTVSEGAITLKREPWRSPATPKPGTVSLSRWKRPTSHVLHLCSSHRHTPSPAGTARLSPARSLDLSASCARSGEGASSSTGTGLPLDKSAVASASVKPPRFKRGSYTWVANPLKSPRSARKWAVSQASESSLRFAACAAVSSSPAKLQSRGAALELGAKPKKSNPPSKAAVSSSQYKWKAASAKSAAAPPPLPASASMFTWKRKEGAGPGESPCAGASTSFQAPRRVVPLGHGSPRAFFGSSCFFNYKLRSWPKVVRRKGSAGSPTLLLKSRYCLRKRHAARGRSSPTGRRTGTKGLVQISKHRLRRLPASRVPASAKDGSGFLLVPSPASHRVVNTRYRLVKKSAGPPASTAASSGSPAHGWKGRGLSSSRPVLSTPTRHSSPGSQGQAAQHRWRGKGLRCIGGVMYRVSANKLSKTSSSPSRNVETATRSHARGAARPDSAPGAPGCSPPSWPNRSITSRYIASRAVQRSLAIIRQAKLRKDRSKEYCMYYNRFGKCKRGESCPYVHDPEKVAVCTRFLRGTCQKTDGTCPFAHKISKDKMPVCSYFLKGICNNSDCPYSHVYVSRKAEVCPDFLKGYCPLGEKCKKKHTLVCPDFSKHGACAKGSQCKLQHPQKKRPARGSGPPEQGNSAKQPLRRQEKEEEEEEEESAAAAGGGRGGAGGGDVCRQPRILPQSSRLTKQPSFISLQSPPASPQEEAPKSERNGEEAGKTLHIKPRL